MQLRTLFLHVEQTWLAIDAAAQEVDHPGTNLTLMEAMVGGGSNGRGGSDVVRQPAEGQPAPELF
jgi:hypothetical protein